MILDPMAIHVQTTTDSREELCFCILRCEKFLHDLTKCFYAMFQALWKQDMLAKSNLPISYVLTKFKR